jgi:hypothetical protein
MSIKYFEPLAMINSLLITSSPAWDRGNGLETQPRIKPSERGDVIPNLPTIARTPAIHGGEEVGYVDNTSAKLETLIIKHGESRHIYPLR